MIVYFADRKMNILGQASTTLPKGLLITDDHKMEDVETGVSVFECEFGFDAKTRAKIEACVEVGNYILRKHDDETEFYTIIDSEIDTKKQTAFIYAEDAGLDLLNEYVGAYEADQAYPISHYIEEFAYDSGFVIGINEAESLTRKLSWEGEATVTERLASVATQFGGYEISFSYDIEGLRITNKKINIYKERGKDIGTTLHLNKEIDNIVVKKTIINVATALRCTGGTPEDTNTEDDVDPVPITLRGYQYDDGDFYVDGDTLKCRSALQKWSRYINPTEQNLKEGHEGHIVRLYSYDTLSQATLCAHAVTELKKLIDAEVNYEADILYLPENAKIGDRVNIVDEAGELFLSTRLLQLETSVVKKEQKATLGEFLIKKSGISDKVLDLAQKFSENAQSAARALELAKTARDAAVTAQEQVDEAVKSVEEAQKAIEEVADVVETAKKSAADAQTAAENAQAVVDNVEESIAGIEASINNAQKAAEDAQTAANTAQAKATEAETAAQNAKADAATALTESARAVTASNAATANASTAIENANTANVNAKNAQATADAAKQDAAKAQEDIDSLGEGLTTLSNTMSADYARKTDLTEATASLQTQIEQNAAEISSTASRVQTIDETANSAQAQAQAAQTAANAAQSTADQATADALAAQNAANNAAAAASSAQSEADKANAAAAAAQSVADKADADLTAAKADLATVSSRVGATEEEIAAAQQAVATAQQAADKANADAATAAQKAATAQTTADTAVTNAATAKKAADDAADKATQAQTAADAAKGDAAAAQATANEAKDAAVAAQTTANTAKTNAETAQAKANQAAADAALAQKAADDADAKAAQAASDLATAQQNLANVTSRVDATAEEVAAAQQAVATAQAAADKAKADAATAQSTADKAKDDAATAQTAANTAKTAADNAQAAADAAQQAADEAQAAVDALAVRVTTTETKITQTSEQIALMATKEEVTNTLGGYYNKTQTDAKIKVEADKISSQASQIDGLGTRTSTLEQRANGFDVSIADSAKTATSFMSYDATNGLQVGNKQSGSWSGSRAQIKSDAFNILDASSTQLATYGTNQILLGKSNGHRAQVKTDSFNILDASGNALAQYGANQILLGKSGSYQAQVKTDSFNILDASGNGLASFAANKVELGKNNQDAVVSFCNNSAAISYDTYYKNTVLSSGAIKLDTDRYINLHSTSTETDPFMFHEAFVGANSADGSYVALWAVSTDGSIPYDTASYVYIRPDGISLQTNDSVRLVAPTVTVEGDQGITGNYYDNLGQPIRNGLAAYSSSSIDPNTTLEELCLTNHANAPQGSGTYYYIHTMFYNAKTTTAARAQVAYPYNKLGLTYRRYYYSGAWSAWTNTALDAYPVGSYYISGNSTSPASLFGGTWHRIESRFLWGAPSTSTLGLTGGEMTHTLTLGEMPSHTHMLDLTSTAGTGSFTTEYLAYTKTGGTTYSNDKAMASEGGDEAHNNMPPYVNVAIWRREA